MIPDISINIGIWHPDKPVEFVHGYTMKTTGATDTHDQEANAVRLAEQMVREAFRRFREKQIANG